jgi:hypothetical protein
MAPWLIITGSGLDDWIYWHLLYNLSESQSITITHNQYSAEPFFLDCRGLAPVSFSFYDWPIHSDLIRFCTAYIVSRRTHRKHIRWPAVDICEPHKKHRFLYCCIYSALHSNGNYLIVASLFVVAYCCRLYLTTECLPRICLRGNAFTESLPSSGSTCHNMDITRNQISNKIATQLRSSDGLSKFKYLGTILTNRKELLVKLKNTSWKWSFYLVQKLLSQCPLFFITLKLRIAYIQQ